MKYALLMLLLFSANYSGLAFTSEDTVFTPTTDELHDFLIKRFNFKKYRETLLEIDSIYTIASVKIENKHVKSINFCCDNLESLQEEFKRVITLTDGKWKSQGKFTVFIPFVGINEEVFYSREAYLSIKERVESAEPLKECKKNKNCYVYHTIFWITFPTVHKESANQ